MNKVLVLIFILLAGIAGLLVKMNYFSPERVTEIQGWGPEEIRRVANQLKAEGLENEAARTFEEYLASTPVDSSTRSNIYYSLGEMFYKASQYEKALAYFYKAEAANPETPLKKEIGKHVVSSLEHLGKSLDAEFQLESRAKLEGQPQERVPGGEVVARMGLKEITMGEINDEIAKLPPALREKYSEDPQKKIEFLKQYVANWLLYDKGVKLGYRQDPEIRKLVSAFTRQLVVQKVLSREITARIHMDPTDVRNFYEANKANYQKAGEEKGFEEVKAQVELDYRQNQIDRLSRDLLSKLVKSKEVKIYEGKFQVKGDEIE